MAVAGRGGGSECMWLAQDGCSKEAGGGGRVWGFNLAADLWGSGEGGR